MKPLKESTNLRQKLKGDLSTLLSILDDLDEEDAREFIKWTCKKAQMYRDATLEKNTFSNLPIDMQRGDIVLCDLGINIPPEFSDKGTGKHFVVYWSQQGHNVIIIPITKHCSESSSKFLIPVGKIEGLPCEENYIKLDSIRSVSLHRISRIAGSKDGKLHSDTVVSLIKRRLNELLIEDQKK